MKGKIHEHIILF